MRFNYCIIILTILSINFHCSNKKEKDAEIVGDTFIYRKGRNYKASDWHCTSFGKEKICIPQEWKTVKQDQVTLFSSLEDSNDNTFFVFAKYPDLSINNYLFEAYKELNNAESEEHGEGYTVKKLILNDKEVYHCEFYTKIDSVPYITYSILINKGAYLYDVALKVERDNQENYETFLDIIYNIKIDGEAILKEKDEIKEVQIIDLSKLKILSWSKFNEV